MFADNGNISKNFMKFALTSAGVMHSKIAYIGTMTAMRTFALLTFQNLSK